jgi:NET1-associated nuclear protein 1 (U3 small nucleolar RNA-associated protein 17)
LVSGGQETVLIIWQLETNKRQDLPHLTSAIQRISISPSGTSYALRLADNSAIVLSTSELAPKALMSSSQSKTSANLQEWLSNDIDILQTPAVENKLSPNQILFVVPATSDGFAVGQAPPAPFLQTFDVSVGRHVSRQALARNNAINLNKAPSGNKIDEANVYMIQTSADGLWLATAEEWSPPVAEISKLLGTNDREALQREIDRRRESYLKFWRWDGEKSQWGLHTRVDSPHRVDWEPFINRIIDLVAFPDSTGFASIGEDGIVRFWKPKSKLKDGSIVRGIIHDGITTWSCSKSMEVEKISLESDQDEDQGKYEIPRKAKLAFSTDGSTLVVSLNNTQILTQTKENAPGLVHFYNSSTGELQDSISGLYAKDIAGMQFLGRYLIILSNDLRVWDVVSNKLVFGYELHEADVQPKSQLRLLAVNKKLNTFAVAFTKVNDTDVLSRILIFDPTSPQPLLLTDLPGLITSLISSSSTSGFIALDNEAEAHLIQPAASQTLLPQMLGQSNDLVAQEDEVMVDVDEESDVEPIEDNTAAAAADDSDDSDVDMDRPSFRGNQLAKIFEGTTSHALPPVQDLFHAVAKLYIGRAGVQ